MSRTGSRSPERHALGEHACSMPPPRGAPDAPLLLAIATTLLLAASSFAAIRVALPHFSVAGLSAGRLVVASAALAVAAPLLGVRRPARTDLLRIVGCGLTGMTGYQVLLSAGERSVPAGTAALLVGTAPVFAALLAIPVLREPVTPRGRAGIALGFAGAATIALAQGGALRPSPEATLVLGAAVAQALFLVLQKPLLARYGGFETTCYAVWSGALLAVPLLPALVRELPGAQAEPLAALLFLAVGPSAVGFVTWAYAQARLPVSTAAAPLYLVPVLAVGIGWVLLGEGVHPVALAGGALALVGVALARPSRASAERHRP
jgi:drug/metabolite transporter (DMT)-like permease